MIIETKKLIVSDKLRRKIKMICRFANTKYSLINDNIKNTKGTNITYVKSHILNVKNNEVVIYISENYDIKECKLYCRCS